MPVTWAAPTRVSQEAGALLCRTVNTPDFEHPLQAGEKNVSFGNHLFFDVNDVMDSVRFGSQKWTHRLPEKMKNPRKRSVFKGLWLSTVVLIRGYQRWLRRRVTEVTDNTARWMVTSSNPNEQLPDLSYIVWFLLAAVKRLLRSLEVSLRNVVTWRWIWDG